MTPISIQNDTIDIGELETHAARVMRQLRETGRPIVITQHGRPAGVLVSAADYDRLTERDRLIAAVNEGLADSYAGRVISDEDFGAELDRLTEREGLIAAVNEGLAESDAGLAIDDEDDLNALLDRQHGPLETS